MYGNKHGEKRSLMLQLFHRYGIVQSTRSNRIGVFPILPEDEGRYIL
jgi:hypothetical protein